jgi:hypothetical protein
MAKNEVKSVARSGRKPTETENARIYSGRGIARISLVIAVMSLILVLFLLPRVLSSSSTEEIIVTPTPAPTVVADCAPGLSAYDLWLAIGNEGSVEDFLDSIVGEKGADGYVGSDGFSGGDGASAYEMWLAAGNRGTSQIFLESLVGASGVTGVAGSPGSPGSDGTDGTPGLAGAAGISAYQLWLEQGNTGTEPEFLTFLLGQQGPAGSDGPAGESSYELWAQQEGNEDKTEAEFLISLIGPQGPTGEAGVCTAGDTGPAGPPGAVTGFGYSGAWYDITDQTFGTSGVKAMRFGAVDYEDGIKMVDGSKITFETAGTYNIQFSAQLSRPSGGNDELVNIWLAKNGSSLANTNSRVIVPGANDGYVVAAWNFFVTVDSGEYVELMWNSSNKSVQIHHELDAGGTGLYQPGIPSIILTVNQVSGELPAR